MSNDAAGFATRYGPLNRSPTRAFDTGLRPDPFPDQTATLLPGLLAATRTGLTPAGDDELQTRTRPLDDHLLITGRTGWSTRPERHPGQGRFPYSRGAIARAVSVTLIRLKPPSLDHDQVAVPAADLTVLPLS